MPPPKPQQPVLAKQVLTAVMQPSASTVAVRKQLAIARGKASTPRPASSMQGPLQHLGSSSQQFAGLPTITPSATSMQGVSVDLVAQLLNSVAASRPSELALQERLRSSQEEVHRLQAVIIKTNTALQRTADQCNNQQETHMRIVAAYTALKRYDIMSNMQAMIGDYLPAETTATAEDIAIKQKQLVQDVTELHDTNLAAGLTADVIRQEDAALLYCTDADKQWFIDQLQHDITLNQFNIWAQ